MKEVSIEELRKATPISKYVFGPFSVVICRYLSPIVSIPAIKHNISPNTITIFMILSGIVGGVLLCIPNLVVKMFCIPVYLLWFVFDCSDGEVARFTNRFSKYGKQLDWMAHLACHPLYIVGIWLTLYQFNQIHFTFFTLLCLILLSLELINRMLIVINEMCFDQNIDTNTNQTPPPSIISYFKNQISWFPNQVILFPIVLLISLLYEIEIFLCLFIGWNIFYCIYVVKKFVLFTIRMYKS